MNEVVEGRGSRRAGRRRDDFWETSMLVLITFCVFYVGNDAGDWWRSKTS